MKRNERSLRRISILFVLATMFLPFASSQSLAMQDPQSGGLTIQLVDDDGVAIGGGTFEIATAGGTWLARDDSGFGELVLPGVASGTAIVSQVTGSDGYMLAAPVTVEIVADRMVTAVLITSLIPAPGPEVKLSPFSADEDGDESRLPRSNDAAGLASLPQIVALQSLPLSIVVGCPIGLDSAQPDQRIRYDVSVTNNAQMLISGIELGSARVGEFTQYPLEIDPLNAFSMTLVSTFTAEDVASGNASIPAPGVTVTDGAGNSASSGQIDCVFAAPPVTIQLGEVDVVQASCEGGYHAPELHLPESGNGVLYSYGPAKDVYFPGDIVTVWADWDAGFHVADFGSWIPDSSLSHHASRVIVFEDVDCDAEDMSVEITVSPNTYSFASDTIYYEIHVTNVGQSALINVTLTDGMVGNSPTIERLIPGERQRIGDGWYVLTDLDLAAGAEITLAATVKATVDTSSTVISATGSTTVPYVVPELVDLTVIPTWTEASCSGEGVITRATVTLPQDVSGTINFGNATWSEDGTYAPGQVVEISAWVEGNRQFGDVADGWVLDSTSLRSASFRIALDEAECAEPGMSITKTADVATFKEPGEVITYTLAATNTGELDLTGFTLVDPLEGLSALDCDATTAGDQSVPNTLAIRTTITCTATYVVGPDDIEAGSVVNLATASADAVGARTASATVVLEPDPAISLAKSVVNENTSGYAAGETVLYELVVTNTGNVPLTDVTVTDDLVADLSCGDGTGVIPVLAPGAGHAVTCSASYVIQQADIDQGNPVVNNASVEGTAPDSSIVRNEASATVVVEPAVPAISLIKSASRASVDAAGQAVTYTFDVTNDGNVTVADISIADVMLDARGVAVTCPEGDLVPGVTLECTAHLTIDQSDIDNGGSILNTATASGWTLSETEVISSPSSVEVIFTQDPEFDLVKVVTSITSDGATRSIDADEVVTGLLPGDVVSYVITATNAGNVTLSNVSVEDGMLGDLVCSPSNSALGPGEEIGCTGTYTLTDTDTVRYDGIVNTASATATDPAGTVLSRTASVTVWPVVAVPHIELTKSADAESYTAVGQEIAFTLTVKNTGDIRVNDVTITDTGLEGLGPITCFGSGPVSLQPDDTLTCLVSYVITQGDLDQGELTNTASAEGFSPNGVRATAEASFTIDAVQTPGLTFGMAVTAVNGTPGDNPVTGLVVGDIISYTLTATNTGNVTLADLAITDSLFGAAMRDCTRSASLSLAPTATLECTVEYTVVQSDVDRGSIVNEGRVSGTAPGGHEMTGSASVLVWTVEPEPAMNLVKTASPDIATKAGDEITYTFAVTNSGHVTISDVAIDDPMLAELGIAVACPESTVSPGAVLICTAVYIVTQTDMNTGVDLINEATASGTSPEQEGIVQFLAASDAQLVSSDVSSIAVRVVQAPALQIVKSASLSGDGSGMAGVQITYSFEVTNAGNITLEDVVMDDPMLDAAGVTVPAIGALDPGESRTVAAIYVVTGADVEAGAIRNEATATNGEVVSPPDAVTVSLVTPTPTVPAPTPTPSDPVSTQPAGIDPKATATPTPTLPVDLSSPNLDGATPAPTGTATATTVPVTGLPSTGAPGASGASGLAWITAMLAAMILAAAIGVHRRPEG